MTGRVLLSLVLVSCGSPTPRTEAANINGTSVVILANHCSHLSTEATRQAEATMSRLVEHCNTLVTHPLTFRVILRPGGSIGFASVPGAGSDEVPMCVVTQSLQHKVRLKTECPLDVRFEPTSIQPR